MATKHRPSRSVSAKKPAAKPAARGRKPVRASGKAVALSAKKNGKRPAAAVKRPGQIAARKSASPAARLLEARPVVPALKIERLAPPLPPPGPSPHDLAVEVFERGFKALQQRSFADAAATLSSIFDAYPDEKELHERARVYLAICERQSAAGRSQEPRTVEERMNAATVALNRGAFEEAIGLLRAIDGGNDVVYYMLAVAHASLGDAAQAIPHLRRAVELNPENRYLALQDADFQPLRDDPGFAALLEPPASSARRPTTRARSGR